MKGSQKGGKSERFSTGKGSRCSWSHRSRGLVLVHSFFLPFVHHSYLNVWNLLPLLTRYKTRGAEIMALWKGEQIIYGKEQGRRGDDM